MEGQGAPLSKYAITYRGRYRGDLVDKAVELMEAALVDVEPPAEDREFTIWVCPACGYYDADPILRRDEPMACFACIQRAMKEWEKETRMLKSYGSGVPQRLQRLRSAHGRDEGEGALMEPNTSNVLVERCYVFARGISEGTLVGYGYIDAGVSSPAAAMDRAKMQPWPEGAELGVACGSLDVRLVQEWVPA